MIIACAENRSEAQTVIVLGTAENFAVLAGTHMTNRGAIVLAGDLDVSPGASIPGFPPGTVKGRSIHLNDAGALQARTDDVAAYGQLAGLAPTDLLDMTSYKLGGRALTPGVLLDVTATDECLCHARDINVELNRR